MLADHVLIGWLMFIRLQEPGTQIIIPHPVSDALEARGWLDAEGLTDQAIVVTDLNAPEWGIDPIEDD